MKYLFKLPRPYKLIISVVFDVLFIVTAFFIAHALRFETLYLWDKISYWETLYIVICISILINIKLGLYRAIIRYLNFQATYTVIYAVTLSSLVFVISGYFFADPIPRTIPIIYCILLLLFVGGSRFFIRSVLYRPRSKGKERIVIYGAGASGRQLAQALLNGNEYYPEAFYDDDKGLIGSSILGIKVLDGSAINQTLPQLNVHRILLAMPSVDKTEISTVLSRLENEPIEVLSIPGIADLVSGKAKIDDLKEIAIEDLLGREPVKPQQELLQANITGKVVMVTGAGGSIGSELCRQILTLKPKKLVLFDLSEFALYQINSELQGMIDTKASEVILVPLIGSVQRKNRLLIIMRTMKVETIYHAAAYKHVPVVEHNVAEGVRNNVFGTLYTAEAAMEAGVETFVLISTDKAVRPTNVMGTSKRMAELILQALSKTESKTRFCMVRFGNVLGSSGSVVPLFRKQIHKGGPVTVTHPDIIRYFMTIPEAAQLVIQAGSMGTGGDVFVLDMGDPVNISDLAIKMINLSGLTVKDKTRPHGDIELKYTGLRPGEKLFEELLIGDDITQTNHSRIMSAHEISLPWIQLEKILIQLDDACHHFKHEEIRRLLLAAPTGFVPKDGICDLVWLADKKNITENN